MSTILKFTFNRLFSHQHRRASEKSVLQVDHPDIYFSRPRNPHHVELLFKKPHHRRRCNNVGIVRCHDYQCIEEIQKRLHDMPRPTITVLLGAAASCSLDSSIDTLIIFLDAENYVRRSFTVNMSWCRRMWRLASRAHMMSVTGVYYSVLGGAYCSLGKSNAKYAYKAGALAIEQIKLAKKLKDTVLECKCWLYFAEDAIQWGDTRKAEKIIMRQRLFVEQNGDAMLKSMLEAVCGKLKNALPLSSSIPNLLDNEPTNACGDNDKC